MNWYRAKTYTGSSDDSTIFGHLQLIKETVADYHRYVRTGVFTFLVKKSKMKFSGVSSFREFANKFKSNLPSPPPPPLTPPPRVKTPPRSRPCSQIQRSIFFSCRRLDASQKGEIFQRSATNKWRRDSNCRLQNTAFKIQFQPTPSCHRRSKEP